METLKVPKGDFGFPLSFTVKNSDASVTNLSGYTITLKVWKSGTPDTSIMSGACVIDVAASGTCHYNVVSGDFNSVGKFKAELELTKTTTAKESTKVFEIEVTESA